MILFALLVPVLMMAFLFITTALEEFLFPHDTAEDSLDGEAHGASGPRRA
ncbi:hypothetical protein [Streptomyces sp. NPDC004658]